MGFEGNLAHEDYTFTESVSASLSQTLYDPFPLSPGNLTGVLGIHCELLSAPSIQLRKFPWHASNMLLFAVCNKKEICSEFSNSGAFTLLCLNISKKVRLHFKKTNHYNSTSPYSYHILISFLISRKYELP
jgi:hypothetical protein